MQGREATHGQVVAVQLAAEGERRQFVEIGVGVLGVRVRGAGAAVLAAAGLVVRTAGRRRVAEEAGAVAGADAAGRSRRRRCRRRRRRRRAQAARRQRRGRDRRRRRARQVTCRRRVPSVLFWFSLKRSKHGFCKKKRKKENSAAKTSPAVDAETPTPPRATVALWRRLR